MILRRQPFRCDEKQLTIREKNARKKFVDFGDSI